MLHYVENHLIPGEKLVSKARLSKVLMVKRIAASIVLLTVGAIIASRANNAGILLVCLPIAAALVALKWLKIQQHELAVTNRKIVAKAGLISRTVQECPLDKIDTVTIQNNLVGAMCGYGTVVVKAINGTFCYTHIVDAAGFKDAILNAIGSVREEEATMHAQRLAAVLGGAALVQA